MNKFKITGVELTNFRQFKNEKFEFISQDALNSDPNYKGDVKISGRNKSGKTGIASAIFWALFGKDIEFNQQTVGNIPTKADGSIEKDVVTEVTIHAILNSERLELTKLMVQNYPKKSKTLKGTTSTYIINGLPASINGLPTAKAKFDAKVDEIGKEDISRMISIPTYFAGDKKFGWKKRRDILTGFVPTKTYEEIVGSGEYDLIKKDVFAHGVDDTNVLYKTQISNQEKYTKKTAYEARLDEAKLNITNTDTVPVVSLQAKRGQLETEKQSLINEQNVIDPTYQTKLKNLTEKKGKFDIAISDLQIEESNAAKESPDAKKAELQKNLDAVLRRIAATNLSAETLERSINTHNQSITLIGNDKTYGQGAYKGIKDSIFAVEFPTCPHCGEVITPESEVEKKKNEFEAEKARSMAALIAKNKVYNSQIKNEEQKIIEANESINIKKESIDLDTQSAKDIKTEIDKIIIAPPGSSDFAERKQNLLIAKGEVQNELDMLKPKTVDNSIKINDISSRIDTINQQIATHESSEKAKDRVNELEKLQRNAQKVLDQLEGKQALINALIEEYISLNEKPINELFDENIEVRMFEPIMSGGFKEVCNIFVRDERGSMVDYSECSTGAKINAGLQIISVLQNNLGIEFPVIVDNTESVSPIYPVEAQCILLEHVPGKDFTVEALF